MDVLAELRGKKCHERGTAVVDVGNPKIGGAAREYPSVIPCPFEQLRFRYVAVCVGRVKNAVVFLNPYGEKTRSN